MRDFRKKIVKNREMFLRSIALLFMDIAIIIISMGGALWIRCDFQFSKIDSIFLESVHDYMLINITCTVLIYSILRLYSSLWRFASIEELKNVIIFNSVQVPHYNYVGDSILGYKSHMGAGSITSNVKSDKTLVVVKDKLDSKEEIETGLKKFGAMLGDYVEVGCNSVLNPGTVIGRHCNVYPLSCVRGVIPAEHIFKDGQNVVKKESK